MHLILNDNMDTLKRYFGFSWLLNDSIKKLLEAFIIILIITDLFLLILISFINFTPYTESVIVDFDTFVCMVLFFEFLLKIRNQGEKIKYI